MVLREAASRLKTFVWIFFKLLVCFKVGNLVSVRPESIKLGQNDGQSQRYLSCDGVNLSTGSNLKLVPVPCAILEWPITGNIIYKRSPLC